MAAYVNVTLKLVLYTYNEHKNSTEHHHDHRLEHRDVLMVL